MIPFICLFLPAFISIAVLNALENKEQSVQSFLTTYFSFVTVINLCNFVILAVTGNAKSILDSSRFIVSFAAKYLILAILFAVLLPFLYHYLRQNIGIRISVKAIKASNPRESKEEDVQ